MIKGLLDFDFTKKEAEAFVFLLTAGPSPARLVARKLNVSRMKAYRLLKVLKSRGLVEATLERPQRFVATPLKTALDSHVEEAQGKVSGLVEKEREIMGDWEKVNKVEAVVEESKFRIVQGRQQVYDFLYQMCERAENEICLYVTGNDLYRFSFAGIDDRLKGLAQSGLKMRILTQIDQLGVEEVESYLGFSSVRQIELSSPLRLAIIDESEVLTTFKMEDSMSMTTRDDTGLWTNAPNYVLAMKAFFDESWRTALDAHEVLDAIKAGRAPQESRIIGTREEYAVAYEKMIGSGKEEIVIMTKRLQDLPVTIQCLKDAADRGVKIRLHSSFDMNSLKAVEGLLASNSFRHGQNLADFQLLIVDHSRALLYIPYWEGAGQAIWSNSGIYVKTMIQVFENSWGNGVPAENVFAGLVGQQVLEEALEIAGVELQGGGWIVESPGLLENGAGSEHSFSLVASNPDRRDRPLVIDSLTEERALDQIASLSAKAIEVKASAKMLVSTMFFDKVENELADLYGVSLIFDADPQRLAVKIVEEIDKIP